MMRSSISGTATSAPFPSFPKSAAKRLRYHTQAEEPLHRLPFVGWDHGQIKFWDVPCRGGYAGGTLTGDALARIFVDTLRQQPESATAGAWFGWIAMGWMHHVFAMAGVKPDLDRDSPFNAFRGQVLGFASILSDLVREALRHPDIAIPAFDSEKCLREANAGLDAGTARQAIIAAAVKRGTRRRVKATRAKSD